MNGQLKRCYIKGAPGSDAEGSRITGRAESADTYVCDAPADSSVGDVVGARYRIIALGCPERRDAFQVVALR